MFDGQCKSPRVFLTLISEIRKDIFWRSWYLANDGNLMKSAYPTLPTQQKSTLLPRVPAHAYADCKILCQQPAQLHKEFPRTHKVGHSKDNDAHFDSGSKFIKWSAATKCLPFRRSVVDLWGGGPRWREEWTENMGFGWWFWLTDTIDRNAWNHHQYEYDNSVDSALRQTQRYDSERHQDLLGKAILCVNFKLL